MATVMHDSGHTECIRWSHPQGNDMMDSCSQLDQSSVYTGNHQQNNYNTQITYTLYFIEIEWIWDSSQLWVDIYAHLSK